MLSARKSYKAHFTIMFDVHRVIKQNQRKDKRAWGVGSEEWITYKVAGWENNYKTSLKVRVGLTAFAWSWKEGGIAMDDINLQGILWCEREGMANLQVRTTGERWSRVWMLERGTHDGRDREGSESRQSDGERRRAAEVHMQKRQERYNNTIMRKIIKEQG